MQVWMPLTGGKIWIVQLFKAFQVFDSRFFSSNSSILDGNHHSIRNFTKSVTVLSSFFLSAASLTCSFWSIESAWVCSLRLACAVSQSFVTDSSIILESVARLLIIWLNDDSNCSCIPFSLEIFWLTSVSMEVETDVIWLTSLIAFEIDWWLCEFIWLQADEIVWHCDFIDWDSMLSDDDDSDPPSLYEESWWPRFLLLQFLLILAKVPGACAPHLRIDFIEE